MAPLPETSRQLAQALRTVLSHPEMAPIFDSPLLVSLLRPDALSGSRSRVLRRLRTAGEMITENTKPVLAFARATTLVPGPLERRVTVAHILAQTLADWARCEDEDDDVPSPPGPEALRFTFRGRDGVTGVTAALGDAPAPVRLVHIRREPGE